MSEKNNTEDTSSAIAAKIQAAAKEGRIACKKALEIADQLGVPTRDVGRTADDLKIKIAACQLGCFK